MKNKLFLPGILGIMLVFGTVSVNAQDFLKKSFNLEYPVYGIGIAGSAKSPKIQDLIHAGNFISGGNRKVTCEEAGLNEDGDEYTIKLLLQTGLTRTARLEVKFRSDAVTERNYVTYLSLHDFSTKRTEQISYKGREQTLEQLITRYIEVLDMFYDKSTLVSS